ncbi:hypothetical protein LEN26_018414 [Aphanomyces euteiches]|nr:hypothetical protein LEN26_018414 [Aphanomyces euteiches]
MAASSHSRGSSSRTAFNSFEVDEVGPRESSFSYQYPRLSRDQGAERNSMMDRVIIAVPEQQRRGAGAKGFKAPKYNGKIKRWRGTLLLLLVVATATAAVVYFSVQSHNTSTKRWQDVQQRLADEKKIKSSTDDAPQKPKVDDEESDDGLINNPKVYNKMGCELPNYVSKGGKIWAVSKNGTEVPISIKGVNWFGMETGMRAPFGLWNNEQNGTTVYEIASFLKKNKFNSVRLPLAVQNILENKPHEANIINRVTNRALDMSSYVSLVQTIVKALGYRSVSVMFSMHQLDYMNAAGSLWYGTKDPNFTEDTFFKAIDMLTEAMCSDEYWNILGIDVKNEPFEGSWGTGERNDFKIGAEKIAARMLKGCPKWMGFVEGINGRHSITFDGQEFTYTDWYGGGLQAAGQFPPKFSIDNKLVYAPHYYTPAVFPQYYLFGGGKVTGSKNAISGYKELSTPVLHDRIKGTMYDMFGHLIKDKGPAVLLGEFAGLYTKDAHPEKTTQRCTESTVRLIVEEGYAGGYMWSLNPESAYEYNPVDSYGHYVEGLLMGDWRHVNEPFLKVMEGLDKLPDLKPMPCFPIETPLNK